MSTVKDFFDANLRKLLAACAIAFALVVVPLLAWADEPASSSDADETAGANTPAAQKVDVASEGADEDGDASAGNAVQAFAVYSATDGSLNFYKRTDVPEVGTTFGGKIATEVYMGIEKDEYSFMDGEQAPWYDHRSDITSVTVVDEGIAPVSTAFWFRSLGQCKSIDLAKLDTSKTTNMWGMFAFCESLTALDLSGLNVANVTDMTSLFQNCSSLSSLTLFDLGDLNVQYTSYMFRNCSSLTSLDLSGFDAKDITRMNSMFADCSSLESLNLSGFDASNATDAAQMFAGCSSLKSLNLTGFDTSNVENMLGMFMECSSLASLDLSRFDTSKATDMTMMFEGCSSLSSLDLSSFDTSNVMGMGKMFKGCSSLVSLDLSSFDTSNVEVVLGMFEDCSSLKSLDLSSFDISKAEWTDAMFDGMSSLQEMTLGKGFESVEVPGNVVVTYSSANPAPGAEDDEDPAKNPEDQDDNRTDDNLRDGGNKLAATGDPVPFAVILLCVAGAAALVVALGSRFALVEGVRRPRR
ncbi:MAG: BspA family leucine-rich repeat surface protein [Eggerthellaceae bacterium]|nr:BspA family leucine-rich repeat surface protein [Eggerthellaceae bacterium]